MIFALHNGFSLQSLLNCDLLTMLIEQEWPINQLFIENKFIF